MDDTDSDDDLIIQEMIMGKYYEAIAPIAAHHGGFVHGKLQNKTRNAVGRHEWLTQQYFSNDLEWVADPTNLSMPVYSDKDFCRQFWLSQPLFINLYTGVIATNPGYFDQRPDACGKIGIYSF